MAVGDHRVGPLDALDEMPGSFGQRREQPERTVDVEPRAVPLRQIRHRGDRIEIARVHLAGASDHDRRGAVQRRERRLERLDIEATGAVVREPVHLRAADAEHPERLHVAGVDVAAAEHLDRRESGEPHVVDVDTLPRTAPPACARERDEVRHGRAGREHAAPLGR